MSDRPSSRDQFAPVAESYLTSAVHASDSALARLVEIVKPDGGSVLDVGTGAGHVAYAFAPFVDKVVAYDMTPEMLGIVERESRDKGLAHIQIVEGMAEQMPFPDGSFDGVACRVAAHHFLDVNAFLSEVNRVLKSDGWFLLVDTVAPEDDDADREVNEIEAIRDPSHKRNLKVSEWELLFAEFGFVESANELNRKRLVFVDWVERMRVSAADQDVLRSRIFGSIGEVRDYFAPDETGRGAFDLAELTLLGRKSSD